MFRTKTASLKKLALVSNFELPKRTQNELHLSRIQFEMTTCQLFIQLHLKYTGACSITFEELDVSVTRASIESIVLGELKTWLAANSVYFIPFKVACGGRLRFKPRAIGN